MIPQRCSDARPHGPHEVPPCGSRTGFTCPGSLAEAEFERLLVEAFGP